MIDPSGAAWWGWGIADFLLTGGATTTSAAIGTAGIATAAAGTGFAHFANPASYFGPVAYQLLGGITNTMHNSPGIDNAGEGISSFLLGTVAGTADWGNIMTRGLPGASHLMALQGAAATGLSHNIAYDISSSNWSEYWEPFEISYGVLSKMYSYGGRGSLVKVGSDVQWAYHLNSEVPLTGSRYLEGRSRFSMINAKINQRGFSVNGRMVMDYSVIDPSGNNDWSTSQGRINKIGHRTLGAIFGGELSYYGFETWGEPYEQWNADDYRDDFWTSQAHPVFNYWSVW